MLIKPFSPNEIVNLFYKIIEDLEKLYVRGVNDGTIAPVNDVFLEEELKTALLNLENHSDLYKNACLIEGTDYKAINQYLDDVYFSYFRVLQIYEHGLEERINSLKNKVVLTSKGLRVDDAVYEHYKTVSPITDRMVLYQILGHRLLIALKQPDKPYLFGLKANIKYEMGKYYFLNQKQDDGFSYTVYGFVKDEKHLDKLREIVMAKESEKEKTVEEERER